MTAPEPELPYDPWMLPLLAPLRAGFRVVNRRCSVPLVEAGLGPLLGTPLTGSILVLRTTGRKTGQVRSAPLGYALVDGRVVVVAGYGRGCHWFRNAVADPRVEVALPGAVLAGTAEEITDPAERRVAFRAVLAALGSIGRLTLGDVEHADDARVDLLAERLPLLAITPTAVRPGPYDPGGRFWRIPLATTVAATVAAGAATVLAVRHARGQRRPGRALVAATRSGQDGHRDGRPG